MADAGLQGIKEGMRSAFATRDFSQPKSRPRIGWQPGELRVMHETPPTFPLDGQGGRGTAETGDESRRDTGKDAGFWLIPRRPLIALAQVYAIGAAKYAPRGWEKGMEWSRIVDPMFRHLLKWMTGEKYDQTDGQHHLASVAWACFALIEYEETHPELDNLRRTM